MKRALEFLKRLAGSGRSIAGRDASLDADLRAEMEAHLEMQITDYMQRGMNEQDARKAALIAAGGLTNAVESVRRQRGIPAVETLVNDLRLAVRTLATQRGYTAAVLLTLGMGIAATVTMFSILNAVVIRPLPFPEPERIVSITVSNDGVDQDVADDRSYEEWLRSSRTMEAMAVYANFPAVLQTTNGPSEVRGMLGTEPYFRVMGVAPIRGRVFNEAESKTGGPSVVVISEQLWRREFGSDPDIVGKSITFEQKPATVIGIMPESFGTGTRAEFWRPYRIRPSSDNGTFYYAVLARMKPGITLNTFRTELETIQRRSAAARPESQRSLAPVVMTLHERRYGNVRPTLVLLLCAVGVLLLITCANIANLSLARAVRRHREFAVRIALGATRWRVVRYVLTESFVLSLGGAVLGLAVAAASLGYFVRISPESVANAQHVGIDQTVLLFTLALTALTSVLLGLVPAVVASRSNANLTLSSASARTAGSRSQRIVRRSLVVVELATALVLMVGAGLVARTFWNVTSIPMGFDSTGVLTATIKFPRNKYTDTTARMAAEELVTKVRGMQDVQYASLSDALPLTGARMSMSLDRDGTKGPRFEVVGVTNQYFEAMGTRIVEGRAIAERDREGSIDVAVVSASLARALFPDRDAIGQQLPIQGRPRTIVGISEEVRQRGLEGESSLVAFLPMAQHEGWTYLHLAARTSADHRSLMSAISQIYRDIEPQQPAPAFRTMDDIIEETTAPRRFVFVLLGIFAALAVTLAVIGLYGVLSYLVSEQTREIGIRIALGADRAAVTKFVLSQGLLLTLIGITGGLAIALMVSGLMEKLVYDLSVRDAKTFAGGAVLLTAVSLLASYLPARRASRVDPMSALRMD